MEIVYRPLADMKPNPKNPRKAVDGGIEALARKTPSRGVKTPQRGREKARRRNRP